MAFDVAIKITSEADLTALKLSEEATKKVAAELKNLNGATVGAGAAEGLQKTAAAATSLGGAATSAAPSLDKINNVLLRGVGTLTGSAAAVGLASKALALLGPAGTVAGAGIAAFGAGVYVATSNSRVLTNAYEDMAKKIKAGDLSQVNADFDQMGGLLKARAGDFGTLQTAWQRTIGIIKGDSRALNTESLAEIKNFAEQAAGALQIRKTQDIVRPIKDQIEQLGAITVPDQIAAAGRQLETELFQRLRAGGADFQTATDKAQRFAGELQSAQFEKFNRGLQEQIDLLQAANDPLEQIAIRTRNLGGGAQAEALRALQENAAKIAAGAPLLAQGLAAIGAAAVLPKSKLDELAVSMFALDQKFQAGLIGAKAYTEGLKGIATSGLGADSQAFLNDLSNIRTELSVVAATAFPSEFEVNRIAAALRLFRDGARAKFGLEIPPEIIARLTELEAKLKEIASEKKINVNVEDAGAKLEALFAENARRAREISMNPITLKINDERINAEIDGMIQSIRDLRAEASQPISLTMDAGVTSSPRRAFSDWMDHYAPGKFDELGKKANSMKFAMDATDFGGMGGGMGGGIGGASAADILALSQEANSYIRLSGGSEAGPGQVGYLQNRRQAAQQALGMLTGGGQDSRSISGGASAVANVDRNVVTNGDMVVNIYIQGPLTSEVLDRELLPKLEGMIKSATGKDVSYRVEN